MDLSPHTLLTLSVLMVVAQLFTSLLLKLVLASRLSARIMSCSKRLRHRRCTHRSFATSPNSALVFDREPPQDRSGLQSPDGTFNMEQLLSDMREVGASVAVPETVISLPTGFVSFIDDQGVLRTEKGYLDAAGTYFGAEPPDGSGDYTLAKVVDMRARRAAE